MCLYRVLVIKITTGHNNPNIEARDKLFYHWLNSISPNAIKAVTENLGGSLKNNWVEFINACDIMSSTFKY